MALALLVKALALTFDKQGTAVIGVQTYIYK